MNTDRITHGPDLVSLVPHLLGYTPADSLVLVSATTKREGVGLLGPSLRIDFAVGDMDALDEASASRSTAPLRAAPDADTVFPIVFSHVLADFHLDWDERDPASFDGLFGVEALVDGVLLVEAALHRRGFHVFPALWSGRGSCGMLLAPESTTREAPPSAAVEGLALMSLPVADSFASSVGPREPDPGTAAALAALRREHFRTDELVDGLVAEALLLESRSSLREQGSAPVAPVIVDPMAVLALERLCERPGDRDIVQMLLAGNHPDFPPERLRAFGPGRFLDYARSCVEGGGAALHIVGLSHTPPRQEALAESIDWLRTCAALVNDDATADVHALIAWFEWARGRMSFADHYVTCALSEQTGHRLALLIRKAVDAGMPPRWIHPD
ncbi:DUF4192 family protein [Brevibacterium yomogidense]|uniref:DUF4192 family protein n=1 Tax=Brevibacterium yomogidense TaxID=946573 RepID=UPI0018DF6DC7|nr:DUF4192 family protein [Brevibacterium yomogidense]